MSGPYKPTTVFVQAVEATDDSPEVREHTTAAQEMWEAIETLQQGESLNIQGVKTNLLWEFGKFTSNDGESMESYYTRFYKLMNEMIRNNLTMTTMQYDWLEYTDEEVDEQELEAHYSYMAKIQEVPNADSGTDFKPVEQVQNDAGYNVFANELQHSDQSELVCNTCLVETDDSNVTTDSPDMRDDDIQNDQNDVENQFRAPTAHDMEILIQTCLMHLAIKTQKNSFKFHHELKQEMHADLKYVESIEKEIDELESYNAEFSDMYDVILQEYVSKDVMFSYLMSLSDLIALDELQCLYLHKVKECDCLAQKLSKQTDTVSKKAQRDKRIQKRLALIAKTFKNINKPTDNNLKTSSNTRNKNVDTSSRIGNDIQTGQFGNQKTMTVAGKGETIGNHVVQQSRIQCYDCKGFVHFAKECRLAKRARDYECHKEDVTV
nr:hypothetical protein [Tanacetum cinerariifolium]